MKNNKNLCLFSGTNLLKVLSYLSEHPGQGFLNSEIQKATLISRAGAYFALKELTRQGLALNEKRGRLIFYRVAYDDVVIRQFKVLKNVYALRAIVLKLKPSSRKIILYGSYSRGENTPSSDVDLFIISRDPSVTKDMTSSIKSKKIQAVIKTSSELADFKENEKTFIQEVERGIVLWEEKE